jgi:hypothetical protein
MRLICVLACGGLLLVGCKHAQQKASINSAKTKSVSNSTAAGKARQGARVTPVNDLLGRVVSVNSNLRFVVIDFSLGQLPQIDQRFSVYRQGQKVGEIKISGPSRDRNIVADITAGEAKPGDEVHSF